MVARKRGETASLKFITLHLVFNLGKGDRNIKLQLQQLQH